MVVFWHISTYSIIALIITDACVFGSLNSKSSIPTLQQNYTQLKLQNIMNTTMLPNKINDVIPSLLHNLYPRQPNFTLQHIIAGEKTNKTTKTAKIDIQTNFLSPQTLSNTTNQQKTVPEEDKGFQENGLMRVKRRFRITNLIGRWRPFGNWKKKLVRSLLLVRTTPTTTTTTTTTTPLPKIKHHTIAHNHKFTFKSDDERLRHRHQHYQSPRYHDEFYRRHYYKFPGRPRFQVESYNFPRRIFDRITDYYYFPSQFPFNRYYSPQYPPRYQPRYKPRYKPRYNPRYIIRDPVRIGFYRFKKRF